MNQALPATTLKESRPPSPTEEFSAPAVGRMIPGAIREARSVRLVWQDPVTGDALRIAMMATPEMIRRLESEGFRLEGKITRSAG
ncbi:hypothetical protein Poly30_41890 [Planctomycetes bacterium Poly30]|uniref:Uncharacterized protein n=1 Tax=Saltatorellus ferox TaxID=2528018 RepID=A0A518EX16_9BACT|nr:hypothetical protein Poly30_41890 [Planctomycetes bacterium Poly30]